MSHKMQTTFYPNAWQIRIRTPLQNVLSLNFFLSFFRLFIQSSRCWEGKSLFLLNEMLSFTNRTWNSSSFRHSIRIESNHITENGIIFAICCYIYSSLIIHLNGDDFGGRWLLSANYYVLLLLSLCVQWNELCIHFNEWTMANAEEWRIDFSVDSRPS